MTSVRTLTLLMVVGLAVGGACSSGGEDDAAASPSTTEPASTSSPPPSTTASTTTTSTTIPATTTTVDPRVVAADKYIELVTPLNCSGEIVQLVENDIYGSDGYVYASDWQSIGTELQPAYASNAQDNLKMMNGLIAFDGWPDDVQSDIDALIQELAEAASYMQSLADAPTFDAFISAGPAPPWSAATVVRAKLGLESNVGTTTQFCVELAD